MSGYLVELEHHELRTLICSHRKMADEAEVDALKSTARNVLLGIADEYRTRARYLEAILTGKAQPTPAEITIEKL